MFGLKRFTLRTRYHSTLIPYLDRMFVYVNSLTVQEQFMISSREFLVLCNIQWKKVPANVELLLELLVDEIEWYEEIIHIDTQKRRTLCFIKGHHDPGYTDLFHFIMKEYLCFLEFPIHATEEYGTFNMVGPPEEITRLLDYMKDWGSSMEIIGIRAYNPKDRGILSILTEKQLSVLKQAHFRGFFDTPRKRDSRKISEEIGIRHTTFLTHLRKGQKRIFSYLFQE